MANPNPKTTPGGGKGEQPKPPKSETSSKITPAGAVKTSPGSESTAPGGDTVQAAGPLYDTSYLNTSAPKNYPIVDQPGGQYKPLSDSSRFVFDKSDAPGTDANNLIDLLNDNIIDQQYDGQNASSIFTNRKYFGANKAVADKLEDVQFAKNYTKPDYIAYLIPYGSPGLASNQAAKVPITISPESTKLTLENTIPFNPSGAIARLTPDGKKFYKNSYIVLQKKNGSSLSKEELDKKAEAEWTNLIDSKNTDQILSSIDSVYGPKNYKSFEVQINILKVDIKPANYNSIISDLKKYFNSYKNSKLEFREAPAGLATRISADKLNPAKGTFFSINPPQNPKNIKYSFDKAVFSADFIKPKNTDPGTTGVDPSLKVWQFLYNPQSITIDVKADYAESNTWGATDDGQSGRSVQWLKNNNPVMRLDEVVLNGFIQNKKVGQLEEGLFALLMSRDGVGQIQPTIWEFVWGKRRFGPCIINNIQVVEKQWEAGEVLSATVSFELTQIPKWQIIDSTVKFYDPTAIGSYNPEGDLAANSQDLGGGGGDTNQPPAAPTAPTNQPGGGGKKDPCRSTFESAIKNGTNFPETKKKLQKCADIAKLDLYLETKNDSTINSTINKLLSSCSKYTNPVLKNEKIILKNFIEEKKFKDEVPRILKEALKRSTQCIKEEKLSKNRLPASEKNFNAVLSYVEKIAKNNPNESLTDANKKRATKDEYINIYQKIAFDIFNKNEILFYSRVQEIIEKFTSESSEKFNKLACRKDSFNKSEDTVYIRSKCFLFIWGAIMLEASKKKIEVVYSSLSLPDGTIRISSYKSNSRVPEKLILRYRGTFSRDTEIIL